MNATSRDAKNDALQALQAQAAVKELEARLYSINESADIAGVCVSTMWRLIRDGKVPSVTIGKRRFVSPITLQALLNGELSLAQ